MRNSERSVSPFIHGRRSFNADSARWLFKQREHCALVELEFFRDLFALVIHTVDTFRARSFLAYPLRVSSESVTPTVLRVRNRAT